MSETKTCTKCSEVKEFDAFRVKKQPRGRTPYRLTVCRVCEVAAGRAARLVHGAPIETQQCTTCRRTKPVSAFDGKKSSGARGNGKIYPLKDCRACVNARKENAAAPPPPLPTAEQMADWYYQGCPI